MEARYTIRTHHWLEACQVAPAICDQVIPRLSTLMASLVETLQGQALTQHAQTSVSGLLSDVERKNVESIAYHVGQNRLGLQGFIGWADWAVVRPCGESRQLSSGHLPRLRLGPRPHPG